MAGFLISVIRANVEHEGCLAWLLGLEVGADCGAAVPCSRGLRLGQGSQSLNDVDARDGRPHGQDGAVNPFERNAPRLTSNSILQPEFRQAKVFLGDALAARWRGRVSTPSVAAGDA